MKKKLIGFLLCMLVLCSAVIGCSNQQNTMQKETEVSKISGLDEFMQNVDVEYGRQIAEYLTTVVNNPVLGTRTSGSDAEHEVADYLVAEMKKIGLKDVKKEEFPAARWQFNSSELKVIHPEGESKVIYPHAYASGATPPEGIETELVYVGRGTMQDYEDIDVTDKVVLVDINMKTDWWVNYPTLEAAKHGAAAIINNCVGGYAQVSEDAMNAQDMVGPVTIPSLNISVNDAKYLKSLLENGSVKVSLKVDNEVEENGKSYNIVGKIPGKTDEEMIIIGDHYDMYFQGFQDNNCAVGMTLAIAKAMIDAGYTPERTITFILHGAEEYGIVDSYYDWAVGANQQVTNIHPEWVGKALAYINFESPALDYQDSAYVDSTPELYSFIKEFAQYSPQPKDVFQNKIRTSGYLISTWTDSWPYNSAGIPATCNGHTKTEEGESLEIFAEAYHSQYDNPERFSSEAFDFNTKFYGAMAMRIDQMPVLPLDFTNQGNRILNSLAQDAFVASGCDMLALEEAANEFNTVAAEKYKEINQFNNAYDKLISTEGKESKLAKQARQIGKEANQYILSAFKMFQDELVKLDGETEIIGHQYPQETILVLQEAIEKLNEGNVDYVVDELLWKIEDEWYSYYFSKEVVDNVTNQKFSPAYEEKRNWGKGELLGHIELYDTVQSLCSKYGMETVDVSQEIKTLEKALDYEKNLLIEVAENEKMALKEITNTLQNIDLSSITAEIENQ